VYRATCGVAKNASIGGAQCGSMHTPALDAGNVARLLPQGTIYNPLKRRAVFQVQFRARQAIRWCAQDLAQQFTRYAHFYPQDLWTTRGARCSHRATLCRTGTPILQLAYRASPGTVQG
jgi:hypothetical protein